MNISEIEGLLEKFYDGTTSLPEEKILRDFFQAPHVPEHLMVHKPMFAFFVREQSGELPDQDFDSKLTSLLADEEKQTPVVALPSSRNRMVFLVGIAASFALLIGLFFTFQQDVFRKSENQMSRADAEVAFTDASDALLLVSGNLNNGLKHMERLNMVGKAMSELEHFNKFYQYQTIIINPDEIKNQSINSKKP
jgi:hypothetical protein